VFIPSKRWAYVCDQWRFAPIRLPLFLIHDCQPPAMLDSTLMCFDRKPLALVGTANVWQNRLVICTRAGSQVLECFVLSSTCLPSLHIMSDGSGVPQRVISTMNSLVNIPLMERLSDKNVSNFRPRLPFSPLVSGQPVISIGESGFPTPFLFNYQWGREMPRRLHSVYRCYRNLLSSRPL